MRSLLLISEDKLLQQGFCHVFPTFEVLVSNDLNRLYRIPRHFPALIDTRVLFRIKEPMVLLDYLHKIQTQNVTLMECMSKGMPLPLQSTHHLNSRLAPAVMERQLRRSPKITEDGLRAMEMTVLILSLSGIPISSTAQKLNLSIKTIYTHRRNAAQKLGFYNYDEFLRQYSRELQAS